MNPKLIHNFLNQHFPDIEGVLLFGSYVTNPEKANDVDLLLVSDNFVSSSRESYIFENVKFNPIKFNPSQIFDILSRNYKQGDFYRIVFQEGIAFVDKNKDIDFIKKYISNSYPKTRRNDLALGLNDVLLTLTENATFLKKELPSIEFYMVAADTISGLLDYFLITKGIFPNKSPKLKSRFVNTNMPIENDRIQNLINYSQNNNQNLFYSELLVLVNDYNIPIDGKYSNYLILDDYSQPQLVLYIENLFSFQEIKVIIDKIKSENKKIEFHIYQVDEDNQEKVGCYIVFENANLVIEKNKQHWIDFIKTNFAQYQYTFPYNNMFCYPEIKFMGKQNEKTVNQLLIEWVHFIQNQELSKELFLASFLKNYILKTNAKIDDIYNFYLGKLNTKSRSSNYFNNKIKETEALFFGTNKEAEQKLISIFRVIQKEIVDVDFKVIENAPIWIHFQVIDRLISTLLKNDFEKLFYINCYKKSLHA
ncbi:nucleotidyltransferase domain-containing protein [Flavobacterium sp.]|uniref:nucleotidyltransferase domain-containing protein n=1 Tax=Flavobacterium sp. TaxID=239 RepID=UPI00286DBEAE|nr:nucleotidyltransferase domain-containing protein [Flavobacterium sp.]